MDSASDLFHRQWDQDYVFRVLDVMREITAHTRCSRMPRHMRDIVGRWRVAQHERVPHQIWLHVDREQRLRVARQRPARDPR